MNTILLGISLGLTLGIAFVSTIDLRAKVKRLNIERLQMESSMSASVDAQAARITALEDAVRRTNEMITPHLNP